MDRALSNVEHYLSQLACSPAGGNADDAGRRLSSFGFRVSGFGFWVLGFGFRFSSRVSEAADRGGVDPHHDTSARDRAEFEWANPEFNLGLDELP